jgi:hypothetical protein
MAMREVDLAIHGHHQHACLARELAKLIRELIHPGSWQMSGNFGRLLGVFLGRVERCECTILLHTTTA